VNVLFRKRNGHENVQKGMNKKEEGLNGLQRNYNIPDITTALTQISLTIYKVTTNVNL
jgi:hypothetical protein